VKHVLTERGAFVSSKSPMGYIDVRVFSHGTEDPEKVLTAVRNMLPEELSENIIFQKNTLTGHHGNPIIIFQTKLVVKQALPAVLEKIGAGLTSLDKEALDRDLKLHLPTLPSLGFLRTTPYISKFTSKTKRSQKSWASAETQGCYHETSLRGFTLMLECERPCRNITDDKQGIGTRLPPNRRATCA
jgi:hypothetical protein